MGLIARERKDFMLYCTYLPKWLPKDSVYVNYKTTSINADSYDFRIVSMPIYTNTDKLHTFCDSP